MDFTKNEKTLIIELIKDKFEMNKQNIEYCNQYIEDGFLMEVQKLFPRSKWYRENILAKYQIENRYNIIIRNSIQKNCLKRELNK